MHNELCVKCGYFLAEYSHCPECREPIVMICNECQQLSDERYHSKCVAKFEDFDLKECTIILEEHMMEFIRAIQIEINIILDQKISMDDVLIKIMQFVLEDKEKLSQDEQNMFEMYFLQNKVIFKEIAGRIVMSATVS